MTNLNKISVVGGGTAGFVAALILKQRFPHLDMEIIRSKKIGIIGVGEGSTEHWYEFMKYIDASYQTVIKHCDATFKAGIMFKGWGTSDYLHSTGPELSGRSGQYPYMYGKLISENLPTRLFNPGQTWTNEIFVIDTEKEEAPFNQYHFNTHKLNDFLTLAAGIKGIKVIDDEILDVKLNELGEIDSLVGEAGTYKSDFYIDSTGFKKILIGKLGAKWQSYSKYLKMKSAIVFPLPEKEEYNMWTTAQTMDNGWMFNIPVWGRSGNGYIFDSDYTNAEKAKEEVEAFLGQEIEVGKQINFDPGALDRVWIKNCCAIGISASFVEPLEATSIGTSIRQAFLLMHRLPNYTEKTIEKYNKDVNDILTNIRDFVVLHYVTKKDNSQFWRDIQKLELPDTLAENLERWKSNLPIEEDFANMTQYTMFKSDNFIQILNGLSLFDREKIRNEYMLQHPELRILADDKLREVLTYEKIAPKIGHKKFISLIRNNKL